jgi:hypothetical protein
MSFSKISLYSVIFFSGISLHNQIIAMEEVTESIKQELLSLDNSIITLQKALNPAKQQMERDKEQLNHCWRQKEETATYSGWTGKQYTMDCGAFEKAYGESSVSDYNGRYGGHNGYNEGNMYLNKHRYTNNDLKKSLMNGSRGHYLGIKQAIKKDKYDYKQFQDNLARGERVKDIAYLQLLKETIQINNQEIQDRNSCISNRS